MYVRSHSEGPLNQLLKPMIFFPCPGLFLLVEFWAARKKIVLWVLHSFVPQNSEVRDSEFKSEPTETHETWLDCVGQEGSGGSAVGVLQSYRESLSAASALLPFLLWRSFSLQFPPS